MNKKISINIIWPFLCLTMAILFYVTNKFALSSLSYLIFNIVYISLISLLVFKKYEFSTDLSIIVFFIGIIPILFTDPIFENDYYRYYWEGKVLFKGLNPYVLPPDSSLLDGIDYPDRVKIAFPTLTTIYPPLAIILFGLVSMFSVKSLVALKILGIINAIIIYWLLLNLKIPKNKKYLVYFLLPLFIKEFINSVHIDLIAAIFIYLIIIKNFSLVSEFLLVLLSFFTKIVGIIYLPILYLKHHKERNFYFLLILSLTIIVIYGSYLKFVSPEGGSFIFFKHWVWNAGFFSLLWRFGVDQNNARTISFLLLVICVSILFFKQLKMNASKTMKTKQLEFLVGTFACINFFSPVFNAWYAIWIAIPSLVLAHRWGIIYATFSFMSYFYYMSSSYVYLGELLSHVWFFPTIYSLFKRV